MCLVKIEISKYVSLMDTDYDDIMWLQLSQEYTGYNAPICLGLVEFYIFPRNIPVDMR